MHVYEIFLLVEHDPKLPIYTSQIKWDAALDHRRKLVGVSVIVRDFEGKVLAIMCYSRRFIIDQTMTEAYEAWKAVSFCRRMSLRKVILKGDTLEIVHALHKEEQS